MPIGVAIELVIKVGAEALVNISISIIFVLNLNKIKEEGDSPELGLMSAIERGENKSENQEYQMTGNDWL